MLRKWRLYEIWILILALLEIMKRVEMDRNTHHQKSIHLNFKSKIFRRKQAIVFHWMLHVFSININSSHHIKQLYHSINKNTKKASIEFFIKSSNWLITWKIFVHVLSSARNLKRKNNNRQLNSCKKY